MRELSSRGRGDGDRGEREAQLERLYLRWLEVCELDPDSNPRAWVRTHAPEPLRAALGELIESTERALAGPLELLPGSRLGQDFELLEEIGAGGFGRVWRARQLSLDRTVALKVLHGSGSSERSAGEFLEGEARNLAAIRHPGVVHVYAIGREAAAVFLAMELVEGCSLADVIRCARRGAGRASEGSSAARLARAWSLGRRAGDRRALALALELCDAVAEIHRRGVYHRDLKPANVLLDERGRPRIADFGLSTLSREGQAAQGPLYGTYDYLPPEELLTGSAGDPVRADLWALASVLFELLTLERPYGRGAPNEVLMRGRSGRVLDPASLRPDLAPELLTVVRHALCTRAGGGYGSIEALREDLERVSADRPPRAGRTSPARRAALWTRRNRALATGGGLSLALLAAVGGAWLGEPTHAADALLGFEVVPFEQLDPGVVYDTCAALQSAPPGAVYFVEHTVTEIEHGSLALLRLRAQRPTWLYVLTRSPAGWVYVNFPTEAFAQDCSPRLANPLPAGEHRVPIGVVRGTAGAETFLALTADEPVEELEAVLAELLGPGGEVQERRVTEALARASRRQLRDVRLGPPGEAGAGRDAAAADSAWLWEADVEELRRRLGPGCMRWQVFSRAGDAGKDGR